MESGQKPAIVSAEKFSDFKEYWVEYASVEEGIEQGRYSKGVMKMLLEKKLLTLEHPGAILERLSDYIAWHSQRFPDYERKDIEATFDSIKEQKEGFKSEVVSESKFISSFSTCLGELYPCAKDSLSVLHKCIMSYGCFPFPVEYSLPMTMEYFTRAVAFMKSEDYRSTEIWEGIGDKDDELFFCCGQGWQGASLGPYHGECTVYRQRSRQDRRRLDFRSLAVPRTSQHLTKSTETEKSSMTMDIVYFTHTVFDENAAKDSEAYWDSAQDINICHAEDERVIDLLDALCYLEPNEPPLGHFRREGFFPVIQRLPHQKFYLHELGIPSRKFSEYMKILVLVQLKQLGQSLADLPTKELAQGFEAVTRCMLNAFVSKNSGEVTWEAFDAVIERNMPYLFCGLAKLADILLHPSGKFEPLDGQPTGPHSAQIYPILSQIATFAPEWSYIDDLEHLCSHNSEQTCSVESLSKIQKLWDETSVILIQGRKIGSTEGEEDTTYVFGALHRFPFTKEPPESRGSGEMALPHSIFQLSPVHRVYKARDVKVCPKTPILSDKGFGFGRALDESDFKSEAAEARGMTSLVLNSTLDQAVFEHGKRDGNEGDYEGFCPFGIGEEGVVKIKVDKIDAWGIEMAE